MTATVSRAKVRAALVRAGHTPSKTVRKKLYDDYTPGFSIQTSPGLDSVKVRHEIGPSTVAHHPDPDGSIRAITAGAYDAALTAAGFTVKRSGDVLYVWAAGERS